MPEITAKSEDQLSPEELAYRKYAKGIDRLHPKSLQELQESVMQLESTIEQNLDDSSVEILELGSQILETARRNIVATHNNIDYSAGRIKSHIDATSARTDSILLQQNITELVLKNIDDPKKMEFFSKVCGKINEMYAKFIISTETPLEDSGISLGRGLLTGVRGMVTTALMFRPQGWKIEMPKPEWDHHYEIDLLAVSSQGVVFPIDITCKTSEQNEFHDLDISKQARRLDEMTKLKANGLTSAGIPLESRGEYGVATFIRVCIPPNKDAKAYGFYKDIALGIPAEKTTADFGRKLETALSI